MIDERMLRIYMFLLQMGRLALEQVPEPYKTAIKEESQ